MSSIVQHSPPNNNAIHQANSLISSQPKWPSSRRTTSFSSSPSRSSNSSSSFRSSSHDQEECSSPNSPSTSLSSIVPSGGVPFSWETIPGIPKKQITKKVDSRKSYLPLPPAAYVTPTEHKKHCITRKDPFFTALVECSKGGNAEDDDHKEAIASMWKPTKSLSTRFGFVNLSCKNSSSVAESLVLLPRGPRRITYDVMKKRSG